MVQEYLNSASWSIGLTSDVDGFGHDTAIKPAAVLQPVSRETSMREMTGMVPIIVRIGNPCTQPTCERIALWAVLARNAGPGGSPFRRAEEMRA